MIAHHNIRDAHHKIHDAHRKNYDLYFIEILIIVYCRTVSNPEEILTKYRNRLSS